MNQKQFLDHIEETFKRGHDLVKIKNSDYAGAENPFRNFEFAQLAGMDVNRAILLRVIDKIARISNLLDKEAMVKDESVEDTCLDIINYIAIMMAHMEHQKLDTKQ
jgi:hypothetical protein